MTTASRIIALLAPLALVLACGTEADRKITGSLSASRTGGFSAWSDPVNLGPTINTPFNEAQSTLSKDELTLFFASNRPEGPDDAVLDNNIWVSQRACTDADDPACAWQQPVSLGPPVNTGSNDAGPALSRDGHSLFFFSNRPVGSFGSNDIWVASRADVHDAFGWETAMNLGPGVNTSGFEGGPGYFENEEGGAPQLYFNRNPDPNPPLGLGGDIYVSEQSADGSFGTAVPVAELNTDATDQRPSIAHNGLDIYFYSSRLGSTPNPSGAPTNDIWVATRESVLDLWSPPTNLGPPINTGAGELHPLIASKGGMEWLYFARNVATQPAVDLDLFVSTRKGGE
jgi:WD40 repeat protein